MKILGNLFPRAPSFRRARVVEKKLSGCKLSFLAPPYSDPFSAIQEWETEPDALDILKLCEYRPIEYYSAQDVDKRVTFPCIKFLRVFSSCWAFKKLPIFQGYGGDIGLGITVSVVEDLPVNESLFDDKILLQEVYRKYDLMSLHNFNKGLKNDLFNLTQYRWPNYLGPLNCQWIKQGADWLYYESQPLVNDRETVSWHTAISDKHMLSCYFSITRSGSNAGNAYRINQRTPWHNYINFVQRIMDSLTLELPPELSDRRAEVQSQSGANSKPIFGCTSQQIEDAKHVMQMWSDRGYTDSSKDENESHCATSEEVSAFIDKRIEPRPLHNSYPLGERIEVVSRIPPEQVQRPLIGPR